MAIAIGECHVQEEINLENLELLRSYFTRYNEYKIKEVKIPEQDIRKLEIELAKVCVGQSTKQRSNGHVNLLMLDARLADRLQICVEIQGSKNEKNTRILPWTADFTRKLGAGRLTSCKSAKDRTSMSITWEQARILCEYGLTEDDVLKVTNTMRARGVRRENAFKNIGMSSMMLDCRCTFALAV